VTNAIKKLSVVIVIVICGGGVLRLATAELSATA
jgi:hypothetical protein